MIDGQYHATVMQRHFLLPICLVATLQVLYEIYRKEMRNYAYKISFWIIISGWGLSALGAFIMTAQESGFRMGIVLFDGVQWGRIIALTVFTWPFMILAHIYILQFKMIWRIIFLVMIGGQIMYVVQSNSIYNETYFTIKNVISTYRSEEGKGVSYDEFVSADVFDNVKKDINYRGEGVVAYGFHPSVLLLNNFNTVDGYFPVHSMKWQNEFREIIAPTLDRDNKHRDYYDNWGGRMYIYGTLGFAPSKDKNIKPVNLYINADALKKYGGKYILSRAEIANYKEQGLEFIRDYDSDRSLYHIYLYSVD